MPYIKPGQLLQLKIAALESVEAELEHSMADKKKLGTALSRCIVCGDVGCSKTPVYVNSVYIHQEDAATAEAIEVPQQ